MAHQKQHPSHATLQPFMVMKTPDHRASLFGLPVKVEVDVIDVRTLLTRAQWGRISYRKEYRHHTRGFVLGFFHELCTQTCPRSRRGMPRTDKVPGNRVSNVRCVRPAHRQLSLTRPPLPPLLPRATNHLRAPQSPAYAFTLSRLLCIPKRSCSCLAQLCP